MLGANSFYKGMLHGGSSHHVIFLHVFFRFMQTDCDALCSPRLVLLCRDHRRLVPLFEPEDVHDALQDVGHQVDVHQRVIEAACSMAEPLDPWTFVLREELPRTCLRPACCLRQWRCK